MKGKEKMLAPYFERKILNVFFMSLSTGIPFLLTLTTLSIWLKECEINNTTIGLFVLVTLPATFRFLFGPLIDEVKIPYISKFLCQRRSWIFLSQFLCMSCLIGISYSDPSKNILEVGVWAFGISFFSSLKDVAIQAYRIEITDGNKNGFSAASSNMGFRIGSFLGGGSAIFTASFFSWQTTYQIFAGLIGILLIQTILCQNSPFKAIICDKNIFLKYKDPFMDIINNKYYINIILFILFYKASDILLSCMTAPFLVEMGYSKFEMGETYNLIGVLSMIGGGLLGGIIINKQGIKKSIIYGASLKAISCLLFLLHSLIGKNIFILMFTIGFDKFIGMLTTSVLITYFSFHCRNPYTSTQFALFSSTGSISRIFLTMIGGFLADLLPWNVYFFLTAISSIPCFIFLKKSLAPRE